MAVKFYGIWYRVESVLPFMPKQNRGHIVMVNLLDAKKGIVGNRPYLLQECGLESFGDALRQKMKIKIIHVTSIFPAQIDTPIVEGIKVPKISPNIEIDKVVRAIVHGIKRKKEAVYV